MERIGVGKAELHIACLPVHCPGNCQHFRRRISCDHLLRNIRHHFAPMTGAAGNLQHLPPLHHGANRLLRCHNVAQEALIVERIH